MLQILFKTIPKATNEIVFVLGLFGLCVICFNKKYKDYIHIVLCLLFLMITWRYIYEIQSSRYASALIYPFSILAAFFLSQILKSKNSKHRIMFLIVCAAILINWGEKNYNIKQINSNLRIIAELHNRFNSNDKEWTLITKANDAGRIVRMNKNNAPVEIYYSDKKLDDVCVYIANHRSINKNILFNVTLKAEEPNTINLNSPLSKYKHILSVYSQSNKKKRENIYAIVSKAELHILPPNITVLPEFGILKNGDLEQLDSPEESFIKFKGHIKDYTLYFDFDESKRTPVNAYFYNAANVTKHLPYYTCVNNQAISGKNSARISVPDDKKGYLFFSQRFYSGTYQYSLTFSGEKNSTVCILYDLYEKQIWNIRPLATYTITSNRVFQINTFFSVPELSPGEYFLVGAWVNGDAYLDNFCLKKINN